MGYTECYFQKTGNKVEFHYHCCDEGDYESDFSRTFGVGELKTAVERLHQGKDFAIKRKSGELVFTPPREGTFSLTCTSPHTSITVDSIPIQKLERILKEESNKEVIV